MPLGNAQTLLKVASAALLGLGAVVAMASHPATAGITGLVADLVFWPLDGQPSVEQPAARLLAAISGGVMVGWGAMLWLVAARVLPSDPALAAALVRTSAMAWFVVDSVGSVVAGAPLNAVLNVAFLAAFLLPLAGLAPRPVVR